MDLASISMVGTQVKMTGETTAGKRPTLLDGPIVVELGDRAAVGLCGGLLAQLGARVILVEPRAPSRHDKWRQRPVCAAGKQSIVLDRGNPHDRAWLESLVALADVLLLSSDVTDEDRALWQRPRDRRLVICDITAFGHTGPLAGTALPEALVEAMTGIVDTTGPQGGAPAAVGTPVLETHAAAYAACAVVAALRVARKQGTGQRIDVALFDVGVTSLVNHLALHAAGKPTGRTGNRHPLSLPWGTFRTADGWILICAGTDEHWRRICDAIGTRAFADDPRFATSTARLEHVRQLDEILNGWTAQLTRDECESRLHSAGIVCGRIVPVAELTGEPNLVHRHSIAAIADRNDESTIQISASPFRGNPVGGVDAAFVPARDGDRQAILALIDASPMTTAEDAVTGDPPVPSTALAGVRVVEVGHYTTAPLTSRLMGALGADVIKVEPPVGDVTRRSAPLRGDGLAYVFAIGNTDKRGIVLDLRLPEDRDCLHRILATADVLVENLKPGSLARLGLDGPTLRRRHPHLIYCAVTGFGADSAYAGRAGLDTVIQGMSGLMSLTMIDGMPTKTGVSASDMLGGVIALLALLSALELRDRSGIAVHFDLSMQDATVWSTQLEWNGHGAGSRRVALVRAADGFVAVATDDGDQAGPQPDPGLTRAAIVDSLRPGAAAPVLTVPEVFGHPQVAARELLLVRPTADGDSWPVFAPPIRLLATPARVRSVLPQLGFGSESIRAEFASPPPAPPAGPAAARHFGTSPETRL